MINIFAGAVGLGLIWGIVTLGIFISYRVLGMPDLSVEGSIVTGAAVATMLIISGAHPLLALLGATLAGAAAGTITGFLHTRLKIPALLSGILTMTALYSINIRIMDGRPNVPLLRTDTLLTPLVDLGLTRDYAIIVIALAAVILVVGALRWFLTTEFGSALRATGNNPHMSTAQGINTKTMKLVGLACANSLVGLAGGLLAQYQGFVDVQMGIGAIVIALASLIIGEVIFGRTTLLRSMIAVVLGAIVYRIIIAMVLEAGMAATDLRLFTAITVALALWLPSARDQIDIISRRIRHKAHTFGQSGDDSKQTGQTG
ncbi:MAG: ABC transporter permease [Coriobacteriia bacterium]|nr:ABC transporter permease [Coriobacteriia bacterium]MCL2746993.1 ABC transporter permease [Coriobacteriia bacterium]MCL2870672.1 ABC transporter permease [Coriobacteriia bacterium]